MAPDGVPSIRRPFPIGKRGWILLTILTVGALSYHGLGLSPGQLVPGEGGKRVVLEFFSRAISPALTYEATVPQGTTPLLLKALAAARRTLIFAAAAMSVAILIGIVLGTLGSGYWWREVEGGEGHRLERSIRGVIYGLVRTLITLMRSVHELLWAVLFLAAFGLNTFSAVIAIAIPYGGTLAKIYSEMMDESPPNSARALRMAGSSPLQAFSFGLLPRALPDMLSYTFYRFECSVRSSAILGFFGYETLGYFIRSSFENLHFGEVWTYLYTLLLLVILLEIWSGAIRRRFQPHE